MGRKKNPSGPKLGPTKLDVKILHRAKLIAADRGEPLSTYLSGLLEGQVEKDWLNLLDRIKDRRD